MGQSTTPKALALGVSLSLACGLLPGAAFAEETPADDASDSSDSPDAAPSGDAAKPAGYDKADFFSDSAGATIARSLAEPLSLSSFGPVNLSDSMKYFARFESGQNYDQGLSWGDGYHAMGYYQFDNRFALKSFLVACYNYDPVKYSMFGWVANTDISGDLYDRGAEELTAIGKQLNDAWHTAYANNPAEFAGLQDSYAYENYYVPAENYLESRGIDISNRSDSLKGLCWGLANLFGTSGWHKFVGGWSDGYVNGTYYTSYNYPGAGLKNDMTDKEFVETLCDYVVAHVGEFYQGQPQYHEGWQNRYKTEKALCSALLDAPVEEPEPPTTEDPREPDENPTPPNNTTTTPPTGADNPADDLEGETPDDTQKPEYPAPPASNGGVLGNSNNTAKPNDREEGTTTPPTGETTPPETTKPSDETKPTTPLETEAGSNAPKKDEPTKEAADKERPDLVEPSAVATEPRDLPKPESDGQDGEGEDSSNAAKISKLSQTGDGTTNAPLGVALGAAGIAAIAGAALATRRIVK